MTRAQHHYQPKIVTKGINTKSSKWIQNVFGEETSPSVWFVSLEKNKSVLYAQDISHGDECLFAGLVFFPPPIKSRDCTSRLSALFTWPGFFDIPSLKVSLFFFLVINPFLALRRYNWWLFLVCSENFRSVTSQFPAYKIPDSVTDAVVVFAFKPPYNPHDSIVVLALSFPQAGNEASHFQWAISTIDRILDQMDWVRNWRSCPYRMCYLLDCML